MKLHMEGRDQWEKLAPWWVVEDLGSDMSVEVQAWTKSEARGRLKDKLKASRIPMGTSMIRRSMMKEGE